MKKTAVLLLVMGLSLQAIFAETDISGKWRQIAPGMAGSNRAIYADSKDPLKLWVTPDMGNDYVTLDGGKHWETTIDVNCVWTQRKTLSDECIVSDPKDNDIVLSLNKKDIYLSTDGSVTFDKINSYASGTEPNSVWYTAVAHPTEDGTWYLANGLDNKYTRKDTSPNVLTDIDQNASKVWKITNITEASRTISAIPNAGMENATAVFDLFCHPDVDTYPDMLFAATSTGFYRKNNANTNWVKLIDGCIKASCQWDGEVLTIYALKQVDYKVVNNVLKSEGGIYKTAKPETVAELSDWENKSGMLRVNISVLAINKSYYQGMLKTWFGYKNGEEKKIAVAKDFIQDFSEVLCDPTDANKAYLTIWGGDMLKTVVGGVWATKDGGKKWFVALRPEVGFSNDSYWISRQRGQTACNVDLQVMKLKYPDHMKYDRYGVRSAAITADGTLYASSTKGYYTVKYDAANDKWISVDNTQVGDVFYGHGNNDTGAFGVIPDKHNPGQMFLLQYEASAYKSVPQYHKDYPGIPGVYRIPALIDIGPTWAPGQPFMTPVTLASHPTNSGIFYTMSARTGDIAEISRNGETYTILGEPIEVPNTINVPEMKCIYWTDLTIASNATTMYAVAEIIDTDNMPMGQSRIYNPEPNKGIYKSTDKGKTWATANAGLPKTAGGRSGAAVKGTNSASIKTLTVDPLNENTMYVAAKRYRAPAGASGWVNGGLYMTKDAAAQWTKVAIPASIKSLWDVKIQSTNGSPKKIIIAGGGEGTVADWGEGGLWIADYKADANYIATDWEKVFTHPFVSHIAVNGKNESDIIVATRESSSNGKIDAGTFYTLDGGDNWTKLNAGRGSMRIGDLSFDSGDVNRVWCACEASGIYTALLRYTTTDIEENETASFEIYPNPAKDVLSIKSDDTFEDYAIYDVSGKTVAAGSIQNNNIQLGNLYQGIYFLMLDGIQMSRFIKQ